MAFVTQRYHIKLVERARYATAVKQKFWNMCTCHGGHSVLAALCSGDGGGEELEVVHFARAVQIHVLKHLGRGNRGGSGGQLQWRRERDHLGFGLGDTRRGGTNHLNFLLLELRVHEHRSLEPKSMIKAACQEDECHLPHREWKTGAEEYAASGLTRPSRWCPSRRRPS